MPRAPILRRVLWAAVLASLTFTDPAGDAFGDGSYRLPTRPAINADALDLRSFRAERAQGGKASRFTVTFGGYQNPWNLASGHSAGVTDIFVKTGQGGGPELTGLRLRAGGVGGWDYHLSVSGAGALLLRWNGGALTPLPTPSVQREGTSLIIEAQIPFENTSYFVTSSAYSPLSPDGYLRPSRAANPAGVQANTDGAPVPLDVLAPLEDNSAYTRGVLNPVGLTRDWRLSVVLLLALLSLGLFVFAALRARRERGA